MVDTPIKLAYTYNPGVAATRFLASIERGEIVGQRCPKCQQGLRAAARRLLDVRRRDRRRR